VAIKPEKTKNAKGGRKKKGRKTRDRTKGLMGEKQNQGRFWSIKQQHLVLLPPSFLS
jgi:hypothetical protein